MLLAAAIATASVVLASPAPLAHAAPSIATIAPAGGPTTGGTVVTITGAGFVNPPAVTFGGVPAATVVFVSATQVTATTPAGAPGAVAVVVTNPDTTAATVTTGFTYQNPPTVASVAPPTGVAAGGTSVTITGTGFTGATGVSFGDTPAPQFSVTNATTIVATTPPRLAAGPVTVSVTNYAGTGNLPLGHTYTSKPEIALISPKTGSVAGGTAVTITGSGFVPGADVLFGGTPGGGVSVSSGATITVVAPAKPAGSVDVVVRNPDGQTATVTGGFVYKEGPAITAVKPDTGPAAGGTAITIDGSGFEPGATVKIGGVAATSVKRKSATQITAVTPPGAAGPQDVVVSNPQGLSVTGVAAFTYGSPPKVISVSPASGPADGGQNVALTGTGFAPGATVKVGGADAVDVTFISSTSLIIETPPGKGKVDIVVTNPDGFTTKKVAAYTYDTPDGAAPGSPTPGAAEPAPDATEPPGPSGCAATPGGGGYVDGMNFVVLENCSAILDVIDVVEAASETAVGAVWYFDSKKGEWSYFFPSGDGDGIGKFTEVPTTLESVVIVLGEGTAGAPNVPGAGAGIATDCQLTPSGGTWTPGRPNFVVARDCSAIADVSAVAAADSGRDVTGVWYYDAKAGGWLFALASVGGGTLMELPTATETVVILLA